MTKPEIRALITKAQAKDAESLAILVDNHVDLVWSVVHRFKSMGGDLDDLFQVGCIGLLKAIEGFNHDFDTTLTTYAVPLIIGEIKAYMRSLNPVKVSRQIKINAYHITIAKDELAKKLGREATISEIAKATGIEEEHVVLALNSPTSAISLDYSDGDDSPLFERISDNCEGKIDDRVALKEVIGLIGKKEQTLIYLRYDLGLTQTEVAKRLRMNQVAVSRLEKKILSDLKQKLS